MDLRQPYRAPSAQSQRVVEIRVMAETAGRDDYLRALDEADGYMLANLHLTLWQELKGRPARR